MLTLAFVDVLSTGPPTAASRGEEGPWLSGCLSGDAVLLLVVW